MTADSGGGDPQGHPLEPLLSCSSLLPIVTILRSEMESGPQDPRAACMASCFGWRGWGGAGPCPSRPLYLALHSHTSFIFERPYIAAPQGLQKQPRHGL